MMAADRASAALGIEVTASGPGWARARMTVRPDMVNGHDLAHGGVIFALADTAFACACNSWGPVTVAAGAEIAFLAPARLGDELEALGEVRTRRGRTGIYDGTVRGGVGAPRPRRGGPGSYAVPGGGGGGVVAESRGRPAEPRR